MNNEVVFVIGNGESRKDFDLNLLKDNGITFGCNYLYKDFDLDVLVALDYTVAIDIDKDEVDTTFIGDIRETKRDFERINNAVGYREGNFKIMGITEIYPFFAHNSGALAIVLASRLPGVRKVYMLGFDFFQPNEIKECNNLYHDNYSPRPPRYEKEWNKVFNQVPQGVEVIRVGNKEDDILMKMSKLKLIDYSEFREEL